MKRLLLLCYAALHTGWAEQRLAGLVQDGTGAVMAAASVAVMDEDTGVRRTVQTNAGGAYEIFGLPPGWYRVTIRRPGFQTMVRWNVRIEPAADLRMDFVMVVGSTRSVLTVDGVAPSLNANDASVGTVVGRDAIDRLPVSGRGILN